MGGKPVIKPSDDQTLSSHFRNIRRSDPLVVLIQRYIHPLDFNVQRTLRDDTLIHEHLVV